MGHSGGGLEISWAESWIHIESLVRYNPNKSTTRAVWEFPFWGIGLWTVEDKHKAEYGPFLHQDGFILLYSLFPNGEVAEPL